MSIIVRFPITHQADNNEDSDSSTDDGRVRDINQADNNEDSDSNTDDGCVRDKGIICKHTMKYEQFLQVYSNREYIANSARADDSDLPTKAVALLNTRMALLKREKIFIRALLDLTRHGNWDFKNKCINEAMLEIFKLYDEGYFDEEIDTFYTIRRKVRRHVRLHDKAFHRWLEDLCSPENQDDHAGKTLYDVVPTRPSWLDESDTGSFSADSNIEPDLVEADGSEHEV